MQDLRLLVQFSVVAGTLSFTEAARNLGVAQPWLSARIRKLEEQLGFALFERSTRRVELTAEGRELHRLVKPLVELAGQVLQDVDALRQDSTQCLRIGCPQLGEPDRQQAALIARFAAAHPRISVEVQPGITETHFDLLRRGQLDLVLTILPSEQEEWESLRLYPLALAVMMREDDPLARVQPLNPGAFHGRRIAAFSRHRSAELYDMLYGPLIAAGAKPLTVPELRRSLLRETPDMIVSTIVPAPAGATLRYGIVRRPVEDMPEIRLSLVRKRGAPHSRPSDLIWAFTANALEEGMTNLK